MYPFLKSAHSYFAWIALIVIAVAFILAAYYALNKKSFTAQHYKVMFYSMIVAHIQLIFGLVLYFVSPLGFSNLSGETMKNSFHRLLAVEHPFTNIIAIVFITLAYSFYKRNRETLLGTKRAAIYLGIGLLLLLSRIPWQTWLA